MEKKVNMEFMFKQNINDEHDRIWKFMSRFDLVAEKYTRQAQVIVINGQKKLFEDEDDWIGYSNKFK